MGLLVILAVVVVVVVVVVATVPECSTKGFSKI